MARDYDPVQGQWYEDLEENEIFQVLSVDPDEEIVEVQYENGDIEEIDLDTWHELDLERAQEPEGWASDDDDDEEEEEEEDDEDDDWDEDEDDDDWDDDDEDDDDLDDDYSDRDDASSDLREQTRLSALQVGRKAARSSASRLSATAHWSGAARARTGSA